MNNQSSIDEDNDKQQSTSNQRPSRSELLTKIYYPDTLYPNTYTFFADRRSSQLHSQTMATNDQSPPVDTHETSTNPSTIPKQPINEIELIERQPKSTVSIDCI